MNYLPTIDKLFAPCLHTVEPPNNGHVWDECFVNCSEVVPNSLEVEMYGQYIGRGVNSAPIVGRLSTPQSVHYQRFHCKIKAKNQMYIPL